MEYFAFSVFIGIITFSAFFTFIHCIVYELLLYSLLFIEQKKNETHAKFSGPTKAFFCRALEILYVIKTLHILYR